LPCFLPAAHVYLLPFLAKGNQQLWYSKDIDDAPEVVNQAREAAFSANVLEPLQEERALIMGVFDRAKGVFNKLFSLLHDRRVGFAPLLHALENMRIDPAGHASTICVAGARLLQGTSPACTGGLVAAMAAQLGRRTAQGQLLSRRTPVAVLCQVIGEALLAKASTRGVG
jgi:hypothetical protein